MAAVPQVLRRPRPGTLAGLLLRAPRLLRGRTGVAVLHLGVEGLADVAATAGVVAAAEVRRTVADRVRAAAGPRALVALEADAVLVVGPSDPAAALAAARAPVTVADRAGRPFALAPVVRAGVARSVPGSTAAGLLDDAATAGRAAARACSEALVDADPLLRQAADERLRLERLLARAVPDGLLRLHYQPLVDLVTGRITGAEALVRLEDEDGVLVLPSELVPVAEATGHVVELGTWVLRTATRQAAAWRSWSADLATVAVNVSACQVSRPDFADVVLAALDDADLPASALLLELTESVLLEAGPVALQQLHRLLAHGVKTGVDDFGTGYASLTYLRSLPVSFVKLDRSFVSGLPGAEDAAVVRAVLGLAGDLGLDCVAEGIETDVQLQSLQSLGALHGQGYLMSRPVPPEQFRNVLLAARVPAPRTARPRP